MHALPNPPEVFEGREAERAWLAARVASASLSIVWGPAGLGKTGLALSVLCPRRPAAALPLSLYLYASALDAPHPSSFLVELGRKLAALGGERVAWDAGRRSLPDLAALVVELAERARATVLLDDLHVLPASEVERLLLMVARYGQHGRFVCLSRARPAHEELADRTLRLEALDGAAVVRLLRRCAPDRSDAELADLAQRAVGSPYRARRLVLGAGVPPESSLLSDLSPAARRVVDALRLVRVAVRAGDDVVRDLDARGLVRLTGGGVRLDDRLRPLVDAEPLDDRAARDAALALLRGTPGPAAQFEALRLLVVAGDAGAVDAHLRDRLRDLLTAGYAGAVFELLEGDRHQELDPHRFACAGWANGGKALAWAAEQPAPADPVPRLAWCVTLTNGGALAKAREFTRDLVENGPAHVRADASLLLADLHRHAGALDLAVALLEALSPPEPKRRIDRDLRLATALALRGELGRAEALLEACVGDLALLAEVDRRHLRSTLGAALLASGRFRALERLLGEDEPPVDARGGELFAYVALAVERGRLAVAESLLRRLRPFMDASPYLRFAHGHGIIRRGLFAGPFDALVGVARRLLSDAEILAMPELAAWAHCALCQVALVAAPDTPEPAPPASLREVGGATRALLEAWRVIREARRGSAREVPEVAAELSADIDVVVRRAHAEAAIARGEIGTAIGALDAALDVARGAGLALEEANALVLLADAHLLATPADPVRAGAAAASLARAAESLGSPRLAAEARLARILAGAAPAPSGLMALADGAASPIAQRRARAILGRAGPLDALDRRIVAIARGEARDAQETRAAGGAPLVIDLGARTVRLPDGRRVDLSSSELCMRILAVLVRGGGVATKEELVKGAWELDRYHPHRDDRRLQVAVHRLRHLLEHNPRAPEILLREGDGYRLGVPVRLGDVER